MGAIIPLAITLIAGSGLLLMSRKSKATNIKENSQPPLAEDRGSDNVRALQQKLNELLPPGYPRLEVDGVWGPKTAAAFDTVINSDIDRNTYNLLMGMYKIIHGISYKGRASKSTVKIDLSQLQGNLTKHKRWYIEAADTLYNAMNRSGTDTFTIKSILRQIQNKDDWKALFTAFDYRPCTQACFAFDGGDLVDWLWRELASDPFTSATWDFYLSKMKSIGQFTEGTFLTKNKLKP